MGAEWGGVGHTGNAEQTEKPFPKAHRIGCAKKQTISGKVSRRYRERSQLQKGPNLKHFNTHVTCRIDTLVKFPTYLRLGRIGK